MKKFKLSKKDIVTGSIVFLLAEAFSYISIFLMTGMHEHANPPWIIYRAFSFLLWICRPFSRLVMLILGRQVLQLPRFLSIFLLMITNWSGWVFVSSYIIKNKTAVLQVLRKPKARLKECAFRISFCVISALVGTLIIFAVIWLTPEEAFPHGKGFRAFDAIMGNKAELNTWGEVFIYAGLFFYLLSFGSFISMFSILFWGAETLTNYSCPHCGRMLDWEMPDPDTVFSCPGCHKQIRRAHF